MINSNDAIWGTSGCEEQCRGQQEGIPWSAMVLDARAWPATPGIWRRKARPSSCWTKGQGAVCQDGQLDANNIATVMGLIKSHL
ncbi:hypothetical protein H2136_07735 [Aeromonas hydrophila]|uniref:Uncharacterized protein n=1 Tax=Aeromonas hydrophila TaxID=644 RepID=A0A926FLV8_AERHY|nr:hypothetical protein [Aeromonas hydrophila]